MLSSDLRTFTLDFCVWDQDDLKRAGFSPLCPNRAYPCTHKAGFVCAHSEVLAQILQQSASHLIFYWNVLASAV
jgi:hypothetical protein